MKVRFSAEARSDLRGIAAWIAADNPRAAIDFVDRLEGRCLELAALPNRYPVCVRRPSLRVRTWGAYKIYYQVTPNEVIVAHIVHGARDEEAVFPSI